jgi:hypothetical protein
VTPLRSTADDICTQILDDGKDAVVNRNNLSAFKEETMPSMTEVSELVVHYDRRVECCEYVNGSVDSPVLHEL